MGGEEEQVNVEGHSEGRGDRGRTGHGGRLLLGCTRLTFVVPLTLVLASCKQTPFPLT